MARSTTARAAAALTAGAMAAGALLAAAPAQAAVPTSPDELVQSWYVTLLQRGPAGAADDLGRDHWVQALAAGTSRTDVTTELVLSEEAVRDHVRDTYRTVLRRNPDPGSEHWVRQVRGGALSTEAVDRAVLSSSEMVGRWGDSAAGRDRYVQDLYVAVLGRYVWDTTPGERAWWAELVRTQGPAAAVARLWDTDEAVAFRVDQHYRLLLRRPADSAGLAYWGGVERSAGDAAVVARIAASSEYAGVDQGVPPTNDTGKGPVPKPVPSPTPTPTPSPSPSTSPSPTPGA